MSTQDLQAHKPSDVTPEVSFFDRFAGRVSKVASRAPFFGFCILLVGLWLVQGVVQVIAKGQLSAFSQDKYQLEINTTTTIITFLMVALLQNSQSRSEAALHDKLNAIADGLADLMEAISDRDDDDGLRKDIKELRLAVGLEDIESSSDH